MSYASAAARNAPPLSAQPQPDPALLNTKRPTASNVVDDTSKLNVASPAFASRPATVTSETIVVEQDDSDNELDQTKRDAKRRARAAQGKAKKALGEAEREGAHYWEIVKAKVLQPEVFGGLLGVVNVGILGFGAYQLYTKPSLRSDTRTLSYSGAGLVALFAAEGVLGDAYANTDSGRAEAERAKERGSAFYHHSKEVVLRPGVLGGIVGLVNLGILGGVGYVAYDKWDLPRWDRRVVSAVSVGLLALWSGEGFLAEQYREKELPKRR